MPRKYDMSKRAEAVERTRRRIVEATMELHNSQGILATSWEQIAERAGVAPATVYRHFPTLDELLSVCGELSVALLDLPTDERIAELLDGIDHPRERIRVMVGELFSIYERGRRALRSIERDRRTLPILQAAHGSVSERLDALVSVALAPLGADARSRAVIGALAGFGSWSALREAELGPRQARDDCAEAIDAFVRTRG